MNILKVDLENIVTKPLIQGGFVKVAIIKHRFEKARFIQPRDDMYVYANRSTS